jgi:hypothetical protein
MWPQEVETDENGVSVVLGATAAAVDYRKAPQTPKTTAPLGPSAEQTPKSEKLRVGVAAGILQPLTQMLIDADVARVDVADVPEAKFAQLGEKGFLETVIPDLRRLAGTHDVTTEIVLASPITVGDAPGAGGATGAPGRFSLNAARLKLVTLVRPLGSADWTPYVEFDAAISQQVQVRLARPSRTTRGLQLDPVGAPDITLTGRFAQTAKPEATELHTDQFQAALTQAWSAWTRGGAAAEYPVADIDFGLSALRLDAAGWALPELFVEFGIPGVKITNSSDRPLVYETKGPYSGWGGPYTLEPGKTHSFDIAYPLTYRSSSSGTLAVFTLPPGSHSEFRTPRAGGAPHLFKAREVIPEPPPEKPGPPAADKAKSASATE